MKIDISPFRKEDVLIALYNSADQVGLGKLQENVELTRDEAAKTLENQQYIDYLHGRLLKIKFDSDLLDPVNYDSQYGDGHAYCALRNMEISLLDQKGE